MVVANDGSREYKICICKAGRFVVRGKDNKIIIGALPNTLLAEFMLIEFCESSNVDYSEEIDMYSKSDGTCAGCVYNVKGRCWHERRVSKKSKNISG